jgi:hypothetical protein
MLHRSISVTYSSATPIDKAEVMNYWLQLEADKEPDSIPNAKQLDDTELVSQLMEYADGDTRVFWKHSNVDWYEKQLVESDFENLTPIDSPNGIGWGCFQSNSRIVDCARQIDSGEITNDTTDFVDVEYIKSIESTLPDYQMKKLIIETGESASPPKVIDGNHHAVAFALHYVKTGEFLPVNAYIGVKKTSILRNIIEKCTYKIDQVLEI